MFTAHMCVHMYYNVTKNQIQLRTKFQNAKPLTFSRPSSIHPTSHCITLIYLCVISPGQVQFFSSVYTSGLTSSAYIINFTKFYNIEIEFRNVLKQQILQSPFWLHFWRPLPLGFDSQTEPLVYTTSSGLLSLYIFCITHI